MPGQNYVLLERIELNATAASVTFDNIPQTGYTDLKVVMSSKSTATGSNWQDIQLRPNGSSTGLSSRNVFGYNGGTTGSNTDTNPTGGFSVANSTPNTFSNVEIYIPNYASNNNKSWSVDAVTEVNGTNGSICWLGANLWSNTAAITSLSLVSLANAFEVGSTFSIYGIANANTTPARAPKADGGNIIATDGTYWYHAFTSNGTFTPQVGLSADVLVVAGGGAGGVRQAGGGGAGGLLAFTSQTLTATGYTCTVGAGGVGTTTDTSPGANGSDSQFGALTLVKGGGGGGSNSSVNGVIGGSGGGGASGGTGAAGTSGQGFAGGNGTGAPYYAPGGGGGAGAVGSPNASGVGGAGGAGVNTYSSWLSATALGVSGYIAGGAGGGSGGGASGGAGGAGGGGAGGADNNVGANGIANTGGGGGGSGGSNGAPFNKAGNGGSGIVIIRYAV